MSGSGDGDEPKGPPKGPRPRRLDYDPARDGRPSLARGSRAQRGADTGQADEGVRHIAKMMADGQWETGASHDAVAATFGVSPRTVESWASQASRIIRALQGDGEELRGRIGALLELHERGARKEGERKNAIMALKVLADVMLPKRVEVKGSDVAAHFAELSDADAVAWCDEKIAQLQALREQRLARMNVVPALSE